MTINLFGEIQCTPGWEYRCGQASCEDCSCACGGKNHGKVLAKPEDVSMKKGFIGNYEIGELSYLSKGTGPLTVISLFSGCGGFDLGSSSAGFETRVMVEWDKNACETLRKNWVERPENWREILAEETKKWKRLRNEIRKSQETPHYWWQERPPAILETDITKLTTEDLLKAAELRVGECSLLTGGFPCQGFSSANSATDRTDYTKDKRNFLYEECVRVIREALPKTFCLENVAGLVTMEKGRVVRMICDDLAKAGYNISWYKINAADYGVPQNRIRVFFFGDRNDVLKLNAQTKKVEFYIGGAEGTITHPDWFTKKYKLSTVLLK